MAPFIVGAVGAACLAWAALAQDLASTDHISPVAVLRGMNVGAGSQFGYSVSVFGGTVVMGSPLVPTGAPGTHGDLEPKAYVYQGALRESDLLDMQPTNPPCEVCDERFASAVAVSGSTAVVGHPRRLTNGDCSGAAYVFERVGPREWALQTILMATDIDAFDDFGAAVAIDGDTIVVGAPRKDGSGAAYVFARTGGSWSQSQKLPGSPMDAGAEFGASVAVHDGIAIIGAPRAGASDSGAARIFVKLAAGWVEQANLPGPRGGASDRFGTSVDIDRTTVVIGAPGERFGPVAGVGAAYVFVRVGSAWIQQRRFEGTAAVSIRYGQSVAISGAVLVIGAPPPPTVNTSGRAWVFTRSGSSWSQLFSFTANDGDLGEEYGWSVAIDGGTIAVGAPGFDFDGLQIGAVLIYTFTSTPCPADVDADGVVNSTDLALILTQWGTHSPTADVNDDGVVNTDDLAIVLGDWGACG